MPAMNGKQLADRLTAERPGLPVVFASAYTHGVLTIAPEEPTVAFLEKPFTAADITGKIRTMLDTRAAPATSGS
jgi:FixJ family two-component response regulator